MCEEGMISQTHNMLKTYNIMRMDQSVVKMNFLCLNDDVLCKQTELKRIAYRVHLCFVTGIIHNTHGRDL